MLRINESQRVVCKFSLAIISLEVQLQASGPLNFICHVVAAAKLQEQLMEQCCTAVNQNQSSEHASCCPVCNNQVYPSKLPKYCSGLPQEATKRNQFSCLP